MLQQIRRLFNSLFLCLLLEGSTALRYILNACVQLIKCLNSSPIPFKILNVISYNHSVREINPQVITFLLTSPLDHHVNLEQNQSSKIMYAGPKYSTIHHYSL